MATGTPLVIGFYPGSQIHLDERYMNNGVAYASTAEVLSLLPLTSRALYLPVNVAGVDYWFTPDLNTLAIKNSTLAVANGSITLVKMADVASGTVFYRKTAGAGPPEVQTLATLRADLNIPADPSTVLGNKVDKVAGSRLITSAEGVILSNTSNTNTGDETGDTIRTKLGISSLSGENTGDQDLSGKVDKVTGKGLSTNDYDDTEKAKVALAPISVRITLPAAASVAARVAAASAPTNYPTGWTLAANSTVNLLITHTLTGKKIASVTVYEIDSPGERLLVPFGSAFTGVLGNATTVLIEGLAPTTLALRIELTFN